MALGDRPVHNLYTIFSEQGGRCVSGYSRELLPYLSVSTVIGFIGQRRGSTSDCSDEDGMPVSGMCTTRVPIVSVSAWRIYEAESIRNQLRVQHTTSENLLS
jgi:hypothetical protein